MLNAQQLYHDVVSQWEEKAIPSLCDYIKIPNKSPHFDSQWEEHGYMEEAINLIATWCKEHALPGMELEVIRLTGRTPLLFIEIPGNNEETILLYGHLDKQPEMNGWQPSLGPWTPVIREGRLYGRGGADDGYAIYAAIIAIQALHRQQLPHSRCVILIEACEESGSYDLPFYFDVLKDRIKQPSLVIGLDSGAGNYDQLWVTTSLRGVVNGELSVSLLQEGVHSGYGSGIVADSFRVARELLSRLEDERTGEIKLASLYCDIPEERVAQAKICAEILGETLYTAFPLQEETQPIGFNKQELLLNRTWRPKLTITGASGLPSIEDAGNVLRPSTSLKLSMRLPPLVSAQKAGRAMQKLLTEDSPYHAKITFEIQDEAIGWNAPTMKPWLEQTLNQASALFYKKPVAYLGEGGTIPFMGMLGQQFPEAQFFITGVLGPHSNAHGPNEFLHLDMVKKLTSCISIVLNAHYNHC